MIDMEKLHKILFQLKVHLIGYHYGGFENLYEKSNLIRYLTIFLE